MFQSTTMRSSSSKAYFLSILSLLCLSVVWVSGAVDVPYAPDLPVHSNCVVAVAQLRPTQFALGLQEIQERAVKLREMSASKLTAYLLKHRAPIAIGPGGIPYLLDGHHLARTILEAGVKPVMYAEVKENWANLSEEKFWAEMKDHNYLYLRDEAGHGPLDYTLLPKTVAAMKDDPYRTLAWKVRSNGGYEKTSVFYTDFQWAEFFRPRVVVDTNSYGKAIEAASALAHSADAQKLPGYSATPVPAKE